MNRLLLIFGAIASFPLWAETDKPGYMPPTPLITTESMLQMMGALLLVLAAIGGLAWFLKRFSLLPNATAGVVKVVAATAVGQRERVVVVEIDKTWLVLGVAPGLVNKLHVLEKPLSEDSNAVQTDQSAASFPAYLNQRIGKENAE